MGVDPIAWLLVHAAATWFMTGLIWFVQVVHYPLKNRVGAERFREYQALHIQRTGWVVGPPMLLEAGTSLAIVVMPVATVAPEWLWTNAAVLALIWVATAIFSVPAPGRLAQGFEENAYRSLVRSNWLRTVLWSVRSCAVTWMLWTVLAA